MMPGMGMGARVQEVGENQWTALPFYKKANHLAGHAMELFDSFSTRWWMVVAAMLLLHRDPAPGGWLLGRVTLIFQTLQVCH